MLFWSSLFTFIIEISVFVRSGTTSFMSLYVSIEEQGYDESDSELTEIESIFIKDGIDSSSIVNPKVEPTLCSDLNDILPPSLHTILSEMTRPSPIPLIFLCSES